MLKEIKVRGVQQKRIAVCTCTEAFTLVLEQLLENWGFLLCRPDDPSVLLLVEEGCGEPLAGQKVIFVDPLLEPDHNRIRLPIKIESLWQVLEHHYHSPPRMHMRKAVDLSAESLIRGEWFETRLNSLSDMGARFNSDRELVKQEDVSIKLTIGEEVCEYRGQVIFSIATGSGDVERFQSGVVYSGLDEASRAKLRDYLISQYLGAVRAGMDSQIFEAGLAYFNLASAVRRALQESAPRTTS